MWHKENKNANSKGNSSKKIKLKRWARRNYSWQLAWLEIKKRKSVEREKSEVKSLKFK